MKYNVSVIDTRKNNEPYLPEAEVEARSRNQALNIGKRAADLFFTVHPEERAAWKAGQLQVRVGAEVSGV